MSGDNQISLGQQAPRDIMPLLHALADLKRIRSAGRQGSIAERLFAYAWARLAAGEAETDVARAMVFRALAATQLGDLDTVTLQEVGVPQQEARCIQRDAAMEVATSAGGALCDWLGDPVHDAEAGSVPPLFVARLAAQPRAGATCPGRGRLMLEPPESHADHCAVVAMFGVLLAPVWGARPETVFLASVAHHLHNALLPDSGFAGEMALAEWLEPAMTEATDQALSELTPAVRTRVEAARCILPDISTPEGCAFHAADTIDRILQVEHHLRAARTDLNFVLKDMELVHAGPVKPFQDAVLQAVGLAA